MVAAAAGQALNPDFPLALYWWATQGAESPMGLRHSYTVLAPIYDLVVRRATAALRKRSLQMLGDVTGQTVLLAGIGSGLDIPLLPPAAQYIGVDITPAMLGQARRQPGGLSVALHAGDVMTLPYPNGCFDIVVMHLILAVVPHPEKALAEALRVLKPGGRLLILDKFLRRGQRAPLRRWLSPLLGKIATRTDVVFEDVLAACQQPGLPLLDVVSDTPVLAHGWFRNILLRKPVSGICRE